MRTDRGSPKTIEKRRFASYCISQLTTEVLDDCRRELTEHETELQSNKACGLMRHC